MTVAQLKEKLSGLSDDTELCFALWTSSGEYAYRVLEDHGETRFVKDRYGGEVAIIGRADDCPAHTLKSPHD